MPWSAAAAQPLVGGALSSFINLIISIIFTAMNFICL